MIFEGWFQKQKYKCKQASKQNHKRGFVQDCAQRIYKAVLTHSAIVEKDT